MDTERKVQIPQILLTGKRGVNIKIWSFLYVNDHRWFTAKEISEYLELPLSTVQLSLKKINKIAPRIISEDIHTDGPGRPEKRYSFQRLMSNHKSINKSLYFLLFYVYTLIIMFNGIASVR